MKSAVKQPMEFAEEEMREARIIICLTLRSLPLEGCEHSRQAKSANRVGWNKRSGSTKQDKRHIQSSISYRRPPWLAVCQ